jgi:hypothetical protein
MLLARNAEGKKPLCRPRCRWVYNILRCFVATKEGGVHFSAVTGHNAGETYFRDNDTAITFQPGIELHLWRWPKHYFRIRA